MSKETPSNSFLISCTKYSRYSPIAFRKELVSCLDPILSCLLSPLSFRQLPLSPTHPLCVLLQSRPWRTLLLFSSPQTHGRLGSVQFPEHRGPEPVGKCGKSHGFRTRAAALVAVLVVLILLVVIALYLTLTTAGSQQDSTALTSTSQKVSTPLSSTNQENSTKLPPSHEEAPGRSCCSTTRVAVLVTEIILLLLIVVCQILPCKSRCSRTQVAVLVVVLVPIVLALALSWALPHGPTAGSQEDSTRTIPEEALDGPTAGSQEDSTRTIPEEALGCPAAWKKHGRNCYFFSPETKPKSWGASRAECTAMGSDLVVIDSREELSYLLSQSRYNYYLLGLTRSPGEQKWKWINNVELDPNMFSPNGYFHDYLCTAIGFGEVHTAPCDESDTTQNMCEKAATIP